jgi:hypothetical protein
MTAPCCYTDANGSSCHCQRAKVAEAALATARADALREAATMGHAHADLQTREAVRRAILALIPQENKP